MPFEYQHLYLHYHHQTLNLDDDAPSTPPCSPRLRLGLAYPGAADPLSIFDDDSIAVVNQPDLGLPNFALGPRDLSGEKRAFDLAYILTDVTFDGRNQGNWQPS